MNVGVNKPSMDLTCLDKNLINKFNNFTKNNPDFWSFKGKATRCHTHAFFRYPAMMVPKMQGKLISSIIQKENEVKWVFDPFVGSGTTMTECMLLGLNFYGQDNNPLAILLCKTKNGPFFNHAIKGKSKKLLDRISKDDSLNMDIEFPNLNKWFNKAVSLDLSKIRRSIIEENSLWARRFFWVVFAETIRLCSNSRTSTYKLHIRSKDEINNREMDVQNKFKEILNCNINSLISEMKILKKRDLMNRGNYKGQVKIYLKDSTKKIIAPKNKKFDLLVTSPPYGDNITTIPYGQYSYLPLQWIPLKDIDKKLDSSCLRTTQEIDRKSLGGRIYNIKEEDILNLCDNSPTLKRILEKLSSLPKDRSYKIGAFCRDLNQSLTKIVSSLNDNAYMVWTMGNRRVGGKLIPMDQILSELLIAQGAKQIMKIERKIPVKRMALKNNISSTMIQESVLIMRNNA